MNPIISVIVPLYGGEPTLARTLQSLQAQTLPHWRAWVVNDASTDRGPSIAADFARRDPRIRPIHRPANGGLAAARNSGLDAAAQDPSRYIHFLDADDWLFPRALETLAAACDASGLPAVASYEFFTEAGHPLAIACHPPTEGVTLEHLLDRNRFASHAHLLPRSLLDDLRFDASLRRCEDYDLWLRLAARGTSWRTVPSTVAAYRLRADGLSRDFPAMLATLRTVVSRAHRLAGVDPPRSRRILDRFALEFATMAALRDPARALPMLGDGPIDPDDLAQAAWWGAIFGHGRAPLGPGGTPSPDWARAVGDWFEALLAAGRLTPAGDDTARRTLSRLLTRDEAIADAMLDRARPGSRLILVGCGRNGRVLLDRAQARHRSVECRDDRAPFPGIPGAPIDAPIADTDDILITPLDDAALARRLPARAIRWSIVREALAQRLTLPRGAPLPA